MKLWLIIYCTGLIWILGVFHEPTQEPIFRRINHLGHAYTVISYQGHVATLHASDCPCHHPIPDPSIPPPP